MTFTLRDYQEESVQALFDYFAKASGNPILDLPTGSGKSLIIAEFIQRAIELYPETRVIMLTHVKELVEQNHEKLVKMWRGPLPRIGIYSAGLKRRDTEDPIIFAGIQSACRCPEDFGHRDLVIIDEAHRLPNAGAGMYRTYLDKALEINPSLKVVGLTATPYRLDGGYLHKGDDRLFTDVAYTVGIERLVSQGYLSPVIAKEPEGQIDTSGIDTARGDFVAKQLENAAMASNVDAAVGEVVEIGLARNLKSWLIFACGVDHAIKIAGLIREAGIEARTIFGTTGNDERAKTIKDFREGSLRCVVNVGVLTTGFDAPGVDLLAMMRPTQSTSLYVQIVGRGTRIAPDKDVCLVLDFGGNVRRHGPINMVTPAVKGEGGQAPMRECPECETLVHISVRICPDCGFAFPVEERKSEHDGRASTLEVLQMGPPRKDPPRSIKVQRVTYTEHKKEGKPDSVCISYFCPLGIYKEWACFAHGGYATKMAHKWWEDVAGLEPPPHSAREAIDRQDEIVEPGAIMIQEQGKYTRIVSRDFAPPLPKVERRDDMFFDPLPF